MIQILQPFKVGNSYTTSIDVHVRDDKNIFGPQNIICSGSDGTIGGLSNDCALDLGGISFVNGLFHSSRHKNIALFIHQIIFVTSIGIGTGETIYGTIFCFPFFESSDVDAVKVLNSSIPLNNSSTFGTSSGQVTASVHTHITETLNNKCLSTPSRSISDHGHISGLVDKVVKTVENTTTSGTCPAVNTTLMNRLASNTGRCIQIGITHSVGISICNPGHLTLTSTHIRSRHVNAGSKETLFGQFHGKSSGYSFKLSV